MPRWKLHATPARWRAIACALLLALAAPARADTASTERGRILTAETNDAARLTPPLVVVGEVGDGFWFYGIADKGILFYDDGDTTLAYPLVDNNNIQSRLGFWLKRPMPQGYSVAINVEREWQPYSTNDINRLNRGEVDFASGILRHAELRLEADAYGGLLVGQGPSASDFTSENDLSGTDMVTYASVSDIAGGQLLVLKDGTISDLEIKEAYSDFDGLGRRLRVRYDTPLWQGFGLRASAGENLIVGTGGDGGLEWDVAATYTKDTGPIQTLASLAYAQREGDFDRLNGSISTIHEPTGLNLTVAGGSDDRDPVTNGTFLYGKLGWRADLVDAGKTSFSVDLYGGSDVASEGSESLSVGVGTAQAVPRWQTTFYAGMRWYDFNEVDSDYRNSVAVLTGALFRF